MIYYLRQDDVSEAYTLIKARNVLFSVKCQLLALASDDNPDIIFVTTSKSQDLEPTVPQEYILKGVVNAAVGQVISEYEEYRGHLSYDYDDDEVGHGAP